MLRGQQRNAVSEEISYPQDELDPADMEDILERLHIGTLRREELKRVREVPIG